MTSRCAPASCAWSRGEHALGLLDLRVDLTRQSSVNRRSPSLDLGAVLEMHRDDRGLEPRLQRDAGDRRHRADRVDIDRHRLAFGLGQIDRDHARTRRRLALLLPPIHEARVTKPAAERNRADAPPRMIKLRFFIDFTLVRSDRPGRTSPAPLPATYCALFVNGLSQPSGTWYCTCMNAGNV